MFEIEPHLSGETVCVNCAQPLCAHSPAHTDDENRWRCAAGDSTRYFRALYSLAELEAFDREETVFHPASIIATALHYCRRVDNIEPAIATLEGGPTAADAAKPLALRITNAIYLLRRGRPTLRRQRPSSGGDR